MSKLFVVGYYDTDQEAISAIEDLKKQGYSSDEISVISKDKTDSHAAEGAATGAATGSIMGGLGGVLAGVGLLAIPGIGPIIAVGPLVAGITGLAAGAGIGGLAGALIGLGLPEEEAKQYNQHFIEGKILVLVDRNHPTNDIINPPLI